MRICAVTVIGFLSVVSASAQSPEADSLVATLDTPAPAQVSVVTNAPEALVKIDGVGVGVAEDGPFEVEPGDVTVQLVAEDVAAWAPRRSAVSVSVGAGERAEVRLDLPFRYRVETFPIGAEVSVEHAGERESLGTSPIMLGRERRLEGSLIAEAPGYLPARVPAPDSLTNRVTLVLRPLEADAEPVAASGWTPARRPNRFIDYALGATAVAAAAVAVHYKFQADEVDDRYRLEGSQERGNPVLKAEAERLDGYSLAALGVMQVSVAVLAIRFVIR